MANHPGPWPYACGSSEMAQEAAHLGCFVVLGLSRMISKHRWTAPDWPPPRYSFACVSHRTCSEASTVTLERSFPSPNASEVHGGLHSDVKQLHVHMIAETNQSATESRSQCTDLEGNKSCLEGRTSGTVRAIGEWPGSALLG